MILPSKLRYGSVMHVLSPTCQALLIKQNQTFFFNGQGGREDLLRNEYEICLILVPYYQLYNILQNKYEWVSPYFFAKQVKAKFREKKRKFCIFRANEMRKKAKIYPPFEILMARVWHARVGQAGYENAL